MKRIGGAITMTLVLLGLGFWATGTQATAAPPAQETPVQHTVAISITQRSWIGAFVDGQRITYGILETGASATYTGQSISLRIGNAGGVQVTLDGENVGILGVSGQVVDLVWPSDEPIAGRAPSPQPAATPDPTPTPIATRGTITERMTLAAQQAPTESPFHGKTWLTYYGRPNVPIMGILGEHDLDELTARLATQAAAYDEANGPELTVLPAYHLVYGMATKAAGDDGSHLAFLDEETVNAYIERAREEGYAVILDVQIGALSPLEAISSTLPYLRHEHVHLAIDPEFAKVHPGQVWPGNPIGFVTAEQVNAVQAALEEYLVANDLARPRLLLVHQFQDSMIVGKERLDWRYDGVDLTLSVDGWGGPWAKISKYNLLTDLAREFIAFKLFYRWDRPMLSERQALGVDPYGESTYIETTPNLIIYQ